MNVDMQSVIEQYAERAVQDMDMDCLYTFVKDTIEIAMMALPSDEAIGIVREYYPDLLEE